MLTEMFLNREQLNYDDDKDWQKLIHLNQFTDLDYDVPSNRPIEGLYDLPRQFSPPLRYDDLLDLKIIPG